MKENFAELGSTLGDTEAGKAKRIMNSKLEFSEKLRNLFDERGVREVGGKSEYVFSTKSCQTV